MPFVKVNIKEIIEEKRNSDLKFREAWDNSRTEYRLLGELIKLRKEQGLTQKKLAEKTGKKQQVISQIEKHEKSPTLKTLCRLADALNVDIRFVPR
ncbi:MAG: helix-turn-helix transcriptional regulator [Oscillospiraceae bacterium]|nr:helix-turn-helix transcriptional regulator [Oscillospiraceae bacterium]